MKNKIYIPLAVFILIFLSHFAYFFLNKTLFSPWVMVEAQNSLVFKSYFEQKDYFIGFSYALASAFLAFSFLKVLERKKGGYKGIFGGLSLVTILYIFGCFLIGCCGSPMLAIYLGLFGASFLGLTKPIVAVLTIVSVVVGYFWLQKKEDCQNCAEDTCKHSPPDSIEGINKNFKE